MYMYMLFNNYLINVTIFINVKYYLRHIFVYQVIDLPRSDAFTGCLSYVQSHVTGQLLQ